MDLVIICGDITHFGSFQQAKDLLSLLTTTPTLFIPGNCDPPGLIEVKLNTIESIHAKCKQIGRFSFLGLGGSSPSPFDTPFELSENEIADILNKTVENCQRSKHTVFVSHSPPKNTTVDVTFAGEHVGSISVREFIERTHPLLVLCGHIHEAMGSDNIDDTIVVNPGAARYGKCAIIDLDETVNVEFDSL